MIANAADLRAFIATTLNRRDLTDAIPRWIQMCEGEVNRNLRVREMVKPAYIEMTVADQGYIPTPGDFLEVENIETQTDPAIVLEAVTPQRADELRARLKGGLPAYYSVVGSRVEIVPHPAEPISIEMSFYARLPPLTTNAATNWLLQRSPDVYLYGSLIHSAPYLKDDQRLPLWQTKFDKALDDLRRADKRAIYGQVPLVAKPRRTFG